MARPYLAHDNASLATIASKKADWELPKSGGYFIGGRHAIFTHVAGNTT
jgi:hypothetical protein